jgi:hypothetical protein
MRRRRVKTKRIVTPLCGGHFPAARPRNPIPPQLFKIQSAAGNACRVPARCLLRRAVFLASATISDRLPQAVRKRTGQPNQQTQTDIKFHHPDYQPRAGMLARVPMVRVVSRLIATRPKPFSNLNLATYRHFFFSGRPSLREPDAHPRCLDPILNHY